MQSVAAFALQHISLAYFVINLDPILLHIGPFSIHWYALGYIVAIIIGLWVILRYTPIQGVNEDQVWGLFMWAAVAGLIGGRLYFVIQQPHLVDNYLLQPINIIAVWQGGMAFFGAIFAATATIFVLAPRYGLDRFFAIDIGALFAAVGQIFGRFGNIINGDILGQAVTSGPITIPASTCAHAPCIGFVPDGNIMPWAIVYLNSHSFAPLSIPFQPAPVYEILLNLIMLAILWPLRFRLPRIKAGMLFLLYLAMYAISQFIVFFARGTEPFTPFLGIDGLKQAQWTAVFVFLACIPLFMLIRRYSQPWPFSQEHPVPWPLPAGGFEVARAAVERATTQSQASAKSTERATGDAAAHPTSHDASVELQVDDLPPWEPRHATGGALRNVFTSQARISGRAP